jgi:hypothetical protein
MLKVECPTTVPQNQDAMDPDQILKILRGEKDVLAPEFARMSKTSPCPLCGGPTEPSSNGTSLFKDARALVYTYRCPACEE